MILYIHTIQCALHVEYCTLRSCRVEYSAQTRPNTYKYVCEGELDTYLQSRVPAPLCYAMLCMGLVTRRAGPTLSRHFERADLE